jgi:SAM-dependent methyltransferase
VARIGQRFGRRRIRCALDVGCGTGLSTTPLTAIAGRVTGVDAAGDMVAAATPAAGVSYLVSSAEDLPFVDAAFDLITVCGAINWIDRNRFLPEARRLLPPEGALVIYDGTDLASMVDDERLAHWHRDTWLVRLPRPPRDESPLPDDEARRYGLALDAAHDYVLDWAFSLDSYVDFLMTQSNVTDFVEGHGKPADTLRKWLRLELAPLFDGEERHLRFGGYIWYLRRL